MLAMLSLRQVLLTPGTVGHHWDWSIPTSPVFFKTMLNQSTQVWSPQYLGYPYGFGTSVLPASALIGLLGSIGLNGEALSKGLLLSVIAISGFSSYQLLLEITRTPREKYHSLRAASLTQTGAIIGGYFYAFSPFLFNELIGGAYTQFIAYSLAPLAILTFQRTVSPSHNIWKNASVCALVLSALAMSIQYLVLVLIIIVIISLPALKLGAASLVKIMLFWLPLNAYWIFPVVYSFQWTFAATITTYQPAANLENLQMHVPTVIQAFAGTGYFTDFFTAAIPSSFYPLWILAPIGVVSTSLVYLVVRRTYAALIPWVGILALSIAVETGPNSPIRSIVAWMFLNIPPMVLFKSPQHLIFPTIISLSVLIGMFAASLARALTKRARIGIMLALLILISIWVSPFFSGNLGGNVDVYQLPPGYQKINDIIAADNESGFRIMYLPAAGSPLYLSNTYQSANQGGDPLLVHSVAPTITSDLTPDQQAKDLTSATELLLAGPNPPSNSSKLLAFLDVKYVVLRYDVVPNFGPLAGHWNVTRVAQNLQKLDGLDLVVSFPEAFLWKVKLARTPLVYAATDVIYDNLPILGIRNWSVLSGEWETYQKFSVNGTAGILKTDSAYGDFELEAETRLYNDQSSLDNWVLWRGIDANNYYYAGQTGIGYFTIGKVLAGQRTELYSNWESFSRGQPVWVKVVARGGTFQVYSGNGTSWTPQFTFVDNGLQMGFVGLRPTGSGQFSNVTISDLTGNLLYRDTFNDSNLIQLILSDRFIIGQTVVLPWNNPSSAPTTSNATARAISATTTNLDINIDSTGPFFLVFAETFDPGWTLEHQESAHAMGNGYANVWRVNSSGTHHISLVFQPQELFQLGLIMALAAIAAAALLLSNGQRQVKSVSTRVRQYISPSRRRSIWTSIENSADSDYQEGRRETAGIRTIPKFRALRTRSRKF
jgi:hypothetical protein